MKLRALPILLLFAALVVAGCGKSSSPQTSSTGASEAQATASGDIPDNQVFLTFRDTAGGYSIPYPEGWARHGSGADVTFENKSNTIHVVVSKGPAPTVASVSAEMAKLRAADPGLSAGSPKQLTVKGVPVVKVTYTTLAKPDPVTGKRLTIITDRYEYASKGRLAIVDLGTPKGVDNVDAFRMISQSFKWL
ncbi:MAG: hypothetical protein QOG26_658 [Solirubrobacterales bacterium]|jgi:hypothetical protein|nr:hypothetical protein [Solirubrobacterales bacterium]MDX6653009.1 hypothetical protein [Solirubrobacterales bacterium]